MSSIEDAKAHIAAGSEAVNEAQRALANANEALVQAVAVFADAVAGSKHEKVDEASKAYGAATHSFGQANQKLSTCRNSANTYAEGLG
jgi:hypothetical protein